MYSTTEKVIDSTLVYLSGKDSTPQSQMNVKWSTVTKVGKNPKIYTVHKVYWTSHVVLHNYSAYYRVSGTSWTVVSLVTCSALIVPSGRKNEVRCGLCKTTQYTKALIHILHCKLSFSLWKQWLSYKAFTRVLVSKVLLCYVSRQVRHLDKYQLKEVVNLKNWYFEH